MTRSEASYVTSLTYLKSETLRIVVLTALGAGVLLLWFVLWPKSRELPHLWLWFLSAGLLLIGAGLGYALRDRRPTLGGAATVVGMFGCVTVIMAAAGNSAVAYLYTVVVVCASALLNAQGVVLTALGCSVGLWLLEANGVARGPLALPAFVLLLATGASWLTTRNLYTAVDWFEHAYEQAHRNEASARQRRAELRRALHALREANERLERTSREARIARQEAEQERALKEQFVANVSHELRTPLNLVVGFAEMLYLAPETYEGVRWTPDLVGDVGEMYRAGRHLQNLVNDILDLSRIDARRLPMRRKMHDLRQVVEDVVETVRPLMEQRHLSHRLEIPEQLPDLLIDPVRIQQVLINLLNNAVRFTDEGGITVRLLEREAEIEVQVEDTGVGIPEDQVDGVFESFSQVNHDLHRRGGAGLGLAISRQLVELHGGSMWVTSELGRGSIFCFTLPKPTHSAQEGGLRRVPDRRRLDYSDAPVVVLEADQGTCGMFTRYLENHKILPARDLASAEHLVEDAHPRAVVVNLSPDVPWEQWTGPLGEVTAWHGVPVIRCSVPSSSWIQQSRDLTDCLVKPVSRATITDALARHCDRPSKILVVDDNPGFVELMKRMMAGLPQVETVVTAYGGEEGLELARQVHPDLILLDLVMPDVGGFEMLAHLRAEPDLDATKVVAVTATSYPEEMVTQKTATFTLTQTHGLSPESVLDLLNVTLPLVRPHYVEEST